VFGVNTSIVKRSASGTKVSAFVVKAIILMSFLPVHRQAAEVWEALGLEKIPVGKGHVWLSRPSIVA